MTGLVASGAVFLLAPFAGMAVTAFLLRGAFEHEPSVDPSQKARVLAQGISEAMNGAIYGAVVSILALIPMLVFAVRLVRGQRAARAEDARR